MMIYPDDPSIGMEAAMPLIAQAWGMADGTLPAPDSATVSIDIGRCVICLAGEDLSCRRSGQTDGGRDDGVRVRAPGGEAGAVRAGGSSADSTVWSPPRRAVECDSPGHRLNARMPAPSSGEAGPALCGCYFTPSWRDARMSAQAASDCGLELSIMASAVSPGLYELK